MLPEFVEFSVEWFTFQKFKSFREISIAFASVFKFSKVLVEWKAPFAFLPWFVFEVVLRPRTLLVRSVKILPEFLEFSVEWFTFQKFKSFREISIAFASVFKFSKVLVEWKAPFAFLPWFVFEVVLRPRTLLVRSVKIYAQIRKNRLGGYKTKYKYTVLK